MEGKWELGHLPQHFYSHLMHAFEVVAYRHPTGATRSAAYCIYERMVHNMHLMVEPFRVFEHRLSHDRVAAGTVVS